MSISLKVVGYLFLLLVLSSCQKESIYHVSSPDGKNVVEFSLDSSGAPFYRLLRKGKIVLDSSYLGFQFKDVSALRNNLKIVSSMTTSVNETWDMQWGEREKVNNHYNELSVTLEDSNLNNRQWIIRFRAFDDGIGFRHEFPGQEGVDSLTIMDELTEFNLASDPTCWWIPGDWDIYEHLYNTSKFSEIDAISKRNHPNLAQSYIPENAVNTPVTMRNGDGLHMSFHEAALTDYAGMTLKVDTEKLTMTSNLVGSDLRGYKVKRALPFNTPWRTIQLADDAPGLIESTMILNLNEPNKLGDVSWFVPQKYIGIWWEMHLGISSWDYASGRHGATTENAKRHIDFAATNNIGGVLIEGWNTGWERWIGFPDREGVFDFVTPYPDYDLDEVAAYAKSKGVEIIMHHETSAAPRTYDQQMDTAYQLMQKLDIHSVKTGYVGKIIPDGEYHHGQWMVNHYRRALETAAKYDIAIDAHEPIKATGIRRTYPNAVSREGLRGQEFNAWAVNRGNPPEHLPIVAFTRMLAGPIDFTPGVFNIKLTDKTGENNNQINTTIAQQLALYVVIYSPIQMACDLLKNYEGNPAFQFIRDVGVDWSESKVLNGEVGDYVTIARKEKSTDKWFVGSITDENAREIEISLDFLDTGKSYIGTIYKDSPDSHWDTNPEAYVIEALDLNDLSTLKVNLAPGGGFALSIIPKDE